MYRSVVRDGKYHVLIIDGIFDEVLFELPTEELADKIAYELQNAWDSGVAWGSYKKQQEMDRNELDNENKETIHKIKVISRLTIKDYKSGTKE